MTFPKDKAVTAHFTGHRPQHIGRLHLEVRECVEWLVEYATERGIKVFVSGMACGVDLTAAKYVMDLIDGGADLYLVGAVPFPTHWQKWPRSTQDEYAALVKRMKRSDRCKVCLVSDGGYSIEKLTRRNEWMADRASMCLGVYLGTHGRQGGTYRQLQYSSSRGLHTIYCDPANLRMYQVLPHQEVG
ncbi:SLOG family protein [Lyngbya sp. CCY1209]|uniref:SLOG family protein n=1 Tax=Lyngbya sp. CCY1209 TaxID=2886103 RepID=UPI002D20B1D7|nr:SLOG family protein [Lyngbya sp. CCY1209]MEB3884039.1 DUF1273 domain-containing protein [Lyngbya sp. CCY1209]